MPIKYMPKYLVHVVSVQLVPSLNTKFSQMMDSLYSFLLSLKNFTGAGKDVPCLVYVLLVTEFQ